MNYYTKTLNYLLMIMIYLTGFTLTAQVVYIPDANFKAALVANPSVNTNGDHEIQVSEAASFSGWMNVGGKNIADLTGIEAFTSLEALICSNNNIGDTLDLSANTSLKSLWCSNTGLRHLSLNSEVEVLECRNNILTALDLSGGSSLRILHCNGNQLASLDVTGQPDLHELIVTDNQLPSLDVSANPNLRKLLVGKNQLTSLDVTNNGSLGTLHCYQNQLTELDVANQPYMTELECNHNQLTSIDLSTNRNLWRLHIYNNELTTLDVSETLMTYLLCFNNQLGSIDLGQKANLRTLRVGFNQLTELDVSGNVNLTDLDCRKNQLTSLNVKNGNYWNVVAFNATGNPGLSCIKVDDVAFAEEQWTNVDAGVTFSLYCGEVDVPDDSFRAALLANPAVNTDGDDRIMISEAEAFSGMLDVSGLGIADLTGIASFTAISGLNCSSNQLTGLTLQENVALADLNCSQNQLTRLNVKNGNNSNFTSFNATGNPGLMCIEVDDVAYAEANWSDGVDAGVSFSVDCIVEIPDPNFKAALVANTAINTSGDDEIQVNEARNFSGTIEVWNKNIRDLTGIEAFTAITGLNCSSNDLVSLDVSSNTSLADLNCSVNNLSSLTTGPGLHYLDCSSNGLTTLNLSGSPGLLRVTSHWNQLSSVDVSANTQLESLHVGINQLTALDVSNNPNLDYLHCGQNQLTSLDVSANTALTTLFCNFNQLTSFDITANPNLTFMVCNDNQLTSLNLKNGHNPSLTTFSAIDNPGLTCVQVDDVAWSNAVWSDNVDPGVSFDTDCNYQPSPDAVYIPDPLFREYLLVSTAINTNGDDEIQLTEAEAYTGEINVFNGQIRDMTGIEAFLNITGLHCGANNITELDVSANVALRTLNCSYNALSTLDVSANTELTVLNCAGNNLSSIDLSTNPNLVQLECQDNSLTSLDISNQPGLVRLYCHVNQLTALDLANQTQLEWLYCYDNQLTSLDVQNNTALTKLRCNHNQITHLEVSNNPLLTDLRCYSNALTELDASANPQLNSLLCFNNQLTSLNIQNGANEDLTDFRAKNNALSCIQVDDAAYAQANWSDDVDENAVFSTNCTGSSSAGIIAYDDNDEDHFIATNDVVLTPNPSDGFIQVRSTDSFDLVRVYSMNGQEMDVPLNQGTLDLSTMQNGIYMIKFFKDRQTITKKVIKH